MDFMDVLLLKTNLNHELDFYVRKEYKLILKF